MRLLVVCLGKTEELYVKALANHHREALVEVRTKSTPRSPGHVISMATRLRDAAAADARRGRDAFARYDEVWCVFDCDDFESFAQDCTDALTAGHRLAVSNPCVEYWFLLHFVNTTASLDQREALQRLRASWPDYDKARPKLATLIGGMPDAESRAAKLTAAAESAGEAHRRPTTTMFKLVQRMRGD